MFEWKKNPKTFWTVITLVGIGLFLAILPNNAPNPEKVNQRSTVSSDSNDQYILFSTSTDGVELMMAIYDIRQDKFSILRSPKKRLSNPRFDRKVKNKFFMTETGGGKNWSKLIECSITETVYCESIFNSEGSIRNSVRLDSENILFAFSPENETTNDVGYNDFDFYILGKNNSLKKITDNSFFSISSINIDNGSVYFGATAPGKNFPEEVENWNISLLGYTENANRNKIKTEFYKFNLLQPWSLNANQVNKITKIENNKLVTTESININDKFISFISRITNNGRYKYYILLCEKDYLDFLCKSFFPISDNYSLGVPDRNGNALVMEYYKKEHKIYRLNYLKNEIVNVASFSLKKQQSIEKIILDLEN